MYPRDSTKTRRDFLRTMGFSAFGGIIGVSLARWAMANSVQRGRSRAALIAGDSRGENVFRALKLIEGDARKALSRQKKVLIKPNIVSQYKQLSATHVECLESILEFLQPIVKDDILIGESSAEGSAEEGFRNYGYCRLKKNYRVKFLDLDDEPAATINVIDEYHRPRPIRFSRLLLDPNVYVISASVMKTHDLAGVTLSLKNIAVGGAIKDKGFKWRGRGSEKSDKPVVHGGRAGNRIQYNLFTLAKVASPDLAVIDGFQGMEGNGPVGGTPVDHRIAIASTDWLSADRVAVELMGFDFGKIGYLWSSAQEGLGQGNLSKIDVVGESVKNHIRSYKMHENIESQYKWMKTGTPMRQGDFHDNYGMLTP